MTELAGVQVSDPVRLWRGSQQESIETRRSTYLHGINRYRECGVVPCHFRVGDFLDSVLVVGSSDPYHPQDDHEQEESDADHYDYGDRVT